MRVLERRIVIGGRFDQRVDDLVERLAWLGVCLRLLPPRRRVLLTTSGLPHLVALTSVLPRIRLIRADAAVVVPAGLVPLVLHQTGEDPIQIFGALEVRPNDGGGVG